VQYPVSNIEISFNAFPDENKKVNDKPEITARLQKLINVMKIIPGKNS
jgi:hypothetical protein